jgi:hypothetical protein
VIDRGDDSAERDDESLGAANRERDFSRTVRAGVLFVESPFGWHLNVRAPDNIAVELLAMKPEASAELHG